MSDPGAGVQWGVWSRSDVAHLEATLDDDQALHLDLRDTALESELWVWPVGPEEWRGVEVLANVIHRKSWDRDAIADRWERVDVTEIRDRGDAPEPATERHPEVIR